MDSATENILVHVYFSASVCISAGLTGGKKITQIQSIGGRGCCQFSKVVGQI